jgi:hypothetical protein
LERPCARVDVPLAWRRHPWHASVGSVAIAIADIRIFVSG